MKGRRAAALFSAALLALCLALFAACGAEEENGIVYTLREDGASYAVTDCGGGAERAEIAAVRDGLPVTHIAEYAFFSCGELTDVSIPDSVTSIGFSAFASCGSLRSIAVPDSVTSMGNMMFYGCGALTEASFGKGVTEVGSRMFHSCGSLAAVHLAGDVTAIGDSAFEGCAALAGIALPASVTRVGYRFLRVRRPYGAYASFLAGIYRRLCI